MRCEVLQLLRRRSSQHTQTGAVHALAHCCVRPCEHRLQKANLATESTPAVWQLSCVTPAATVV